MLRRLLLASHRVPLPLASPSRSTCADVMESKSKVIEAEKLRAIGLANRVDHEKEVRKRKQLELQAMINEKKAELERLATQYDSLTRVEAEQKALIEKLTNNEA